MKLENRQKIGKIISPLFPNLSNCGHCGLPWSVCDNHSTKYTTHKACFPLCEDCWGELTPETRLPFYRELYESWLRFGPPKDFTWRDIKKAVMEGK